MFFKKYSELYDTINSDKPYKKEINFVYEWAKKPRSIVDIGCGTAAYWRHYPPGVDVIGIEKSKSMIARSDFKCRIHNFDITTAAPNWKLDTATALFQVINYIPRHDWWKNIPVKKGGYFIFDMWDKERVDKDGFQETSKMVDGVFRIIRPINYDGKSVDLKIDVWSAEDYFQESHKMYLYSSLDIQRFCGNEFEIVAVKPTKRWQTWYKCRRK